MKKEDIKKLFIFTEIIYIVLAFSFYFLAYEKIQLSRLLKGNNYPIIAVILGIVLCLILMISYNNFLKGKTNYIVIPILAFYRYKFLIDQLVSRDIKSKYKRSILGVFWSFLNPLLTSTVQFLVFSTLFKTDTKIYPVYLLIGVVCFNYFNEVASMCILSVTGNTNLINKVYIPKYIFPLAKTMSSTFNFALSLIPLLLLCLITGLLFNKSVLLSLYFIVCLVVFSFGIGLILATLMVFFRDIQFLWTVISQVWMYATPIFYPAEIIPEKYKFIVRLNPLYHFIGNARKCVIDGVSPEMRAYVFCFVFALGSLLLGAHIFKKEQDKFSLYL